MENFGVAKGDIFKSFPKEIPQLSIINYPLSIRASAREMTIYCVYYSRIFPNRKEKVLKQTKNDLNPIKDAL